MATDSSIPARMTVVAITEPGGPLMLKPQKRIVPSPEAGEILIRVRAAGVNRPDVLQRKGAYPPPPGASDLPGLEVAGEVAAVGRQTERWKVGDSVCALVPGGGYAEYCRVHGSNALPVPGGFTMSEAAALPETFFTVWHNVFQRGGLKAGETLLVHGGSSGIGTTAIQLAKAFGATVIVTAGRDEKCAACIELGADRAINYRSEDFVAAVKEFTRGDGANVILDMVGGDYIARNLRCIALEGRLVIIAFLHGSRVEVDWMPIMLKRLTVTGSTMRASPVERKVAIAAALRERVWPLYASGRVMPVIHRVFPLADAAAAHALMESSQHVGKIMLDVG